MWRLMMKCPVCGETRVAWKKEMWGAGEPQFWHTRKKLAFLCGATYQVDEATGTIEETFAKCRNEKTN
jgi:hypothetical protein